MRIHVVSDRHVEFGSRDSVPTIAFDVAVLAGDMHKATRVVDFATDYLETAETQVIFVLGNHEYYRGDFVDTLAALRAEAATVPNFHLLENDTVIIGDTRFIGCTLWTSFELSGQDKVLQSMEFSKRCVNDFWLIQHEGQRLTPQAVAERFWESYRWLDAELEKPFNGKTVVVTHFAPHRAAIHPRYLGRGNDQLSPYFYSDCSPLMRKYPIDLWLYGHTHNSVDCIVENGTRLVSNQRGYPNEDPNYTQFDPQKIVIL